METWTTPVLMAEVHSLIFYNAIRQATGCTVLKGIREHDRPTWLHALTKLLHRVFFLGTTLAIWVGHRRALKAGRYGFGRFWHTAWAKMGHAWRMMDPACYRW